MFVLLSAVHTLIRQEERCDRDRCCESERQCDNKHVETESAGRKHHTKTPDSTDGRDEERQKFDKRTPWTRHPSDHSYDDFI